MLKVAKSPKIRETEKKLRTKNSKEVIHKRIISSTSIILAAFRSAASLEPAHSFVMWIDAWSFGSGQDFDPHRTTIYVESNSSYLCVLAFYKAFYKEGKVL